MIDWRSENSRIGHTVTEGELLYRIDPSDYELEVRRIEDQLKQADANLKEAALEIQATKTRIEIAKEEHEIQKREMDRLERLAKSSSVSLSEVDSGKLKEIQVRSELKTLEDQLNTQSARQESLGVSRDLVSRELEKANLNLTRTEIRSPVAGLITSEPLEQGAYVQPGTSIIQLQDISIMDIRCSLQMKEMHWLWQSSSSDATEDKTQTAVSRLWKIPKTRVTVIYNMDGIECHWKGTLQYFDGGKVDQQTRMIPCRVEIANPTDVDIKSHSRRNVTPPVLMAGMFVNIEVHSEPAISLLSLPQQAIQPGGTVWTVRGGSLHKTPVNIAHSRDGVVLIYEADSDLSPEDVVVVSPLSDPVENMAVQVQKSIQSEAVSTIEGRVQ
ncbi:MAG: hypothetical protein R3C11_24470 [Planctomycetaceae bacterium]